MYFSAQGYLTVTLEEYLQSFLLGDGSLWIFSSITMRDLRAVLSYCFFVIISVISVLSKHVYFCPPRLALFFFLQLLWICFFWWIKGVLTRDVSKTPDGLGQPSVSMVLLQRRVELPINLPESYPRSSLCKKWPRRCTERSLLSLFCSLNICFLYCGRAEDSKGLHAWVVDEVSSLEYQDRQEPL